MIYILIYIKNFILAFIFNASFLKLIKSTMKKVIRFLKQNNGFFEFSRSRGRHLLTKSCPKMTES